MYVTSSRVRRAADVNLNNINTDKQRNRNRKKKRRLWEQCYSTADSQGKTHSPETKRKAQRKKEERSTAHRNRSPHQSALMKAFEQRQVLRSIFGEQSEDQIHHIPVWRSTSVERWRERPKWNLRSTRSTFVQEEQQS